MAVMRKRRAPVTSGGGRFCRHGTAGVELTARERGKFDEVCSQNTSCHTCVIAARWHPGYGASSLGRLHAGSLEAFHQCRIGVNDPTPLWAIYLPRYQSFLADPDVDDLRANSEFLR